MEQQKHTESYSGKVKHLQFITKWDERTCEMFTDLVLKYLKKFGYMKNPDPENWNPYNENDLGKMLLDMALHYNKQQGIEYNVELTKDDYDVKLKKVLDWLNK